MTQHVRKSYRDHRKSTWALVLAAVAAIATVVIPFATGAPPKQYSFTASPTAVCFTGGVQEQVFDLTLRHEGSNNTLGSAEITAPPGGFVSLKPGSLSGANPSSSLAGNVIKLRNLALTTANPSITVQVTATVSVGTGSWSSVAKQSNDFADAPGPGNLFGLKGAAPSLTVSACDYRFVTGPVDAERGSAQTVQVQRWAGGSPAPATGLLGLSALQGGTASSNFSGLELRAPDLPELPALAFSRLANDPFRLLSVEN
jgi:hypothetical protein